MLQRSAILFILLLASPLALAQSGPHWRYGYAPSAAEWEAEWEKKVDYRSNAVYLNPCTQTRSGLVPTPPNDPAKFLNGQCTWAVPPSSGLFIPNSVLIGGNGTSLTIPSAASATAFLNVFTGDSGNGGVKGLVPAPSIGDAAAGKVLGAGGGWVGIGTSNTLNAADFGAVCDGGSHALSTRYASLGAAQARYPFVTSLAQQIDYAALKKMSNTALGADGSEHGSDSKLNIPMVIPQGTCYIGADTWVIRNADGISISGSAATATTIKGDGVVLQFDGLWYSRLSDFGITTTSSLAGVALDIDGNVPGHAYPTRGVQADTFIDLLVQGGGSSYAVAMCRQGGNGGQCSESTWINLHGSNAASAVYYQNGFNALDNVIVGGDVQNFAADGIYILNGNAHIIGMSFESTFGPVQLDNGGCDVHTAGGVYEATTMQGSRSEDLCLFSGGQANISGVSQLASSMVPWAATTAYTLNQVTTFSNAYVSQAYRVTTPGTSGGSQPTAGAGTVTDGGVTWTQMLYNAITANSGWFDHQSSHLDPTAGVHAAVNFTTGSNGRGPSSGDLATMAVDGDSAVSENCIYAQSEFACLYANPQSTDRTLASGVPLPASSGGIIGYPLTVIGGYTAREIHIGGATNSGVKIGGGSGTYIFASSPFQADSVTFATLPSCDGGWKGYEIFVSDATDPGRGAAIISGGGGGVKAICNGTNWVAE